MDSHLILNLFVVIFAIISLASAKHHKEAKHKKMSDEDCTEEFRGCRFVNGDCECGVEVACSNPFPYLSAHQCEKDITGELDKCRKAPCENGQCVQVKTAEGYRSWECSCAGSGYHGRRCQHKCPPLEKDIITPEGYPSDCVY